jgi:hypothetical protein
VRQQHHGPVPLGRKPAGIYQVVFGIRSAYGGGEPQEVGSVPFDCLFELWIGNGPSTENLDFTMLQTKISRRLVGLKFVARRDDALVVFTQKRFGIVGFISRRVAIPARPLLGPLQSPFKRAHHAVVIYQCEAGLPVVHPP